MNPLRFLRMPLSAMFLLFLFSCNNASDGSASTTDTATADTIVTEAPASTIVTTPENMMVVIHKVSDYTKWLASFEAHDSMKLANGLHNYVIGRNMEDSNTLLVATKADDIAKAKAFSKSPDLKQAMKKGGVAGTPTIRMINAVYQDTAHISTPLRAMTTFTVKDWDAWKTSFESNRQLRVDNGVVDRVYGYDPDDNHKVTLVVAITDTAKANAFWDSDLIKQKRAESGVVSQPERFIFNVTKRY